MLGLALEARAMAEKVAFMKSENEKIRNEYEDEKLKWDNSNRKMLRDQSQYECEIRTLRSELEETRQNLQEKSILCETLTRELDLTKLKNFPEVVSDKQIMATQLKASQSRNSFLDGEIKSLSDRNEQLVKEIESTNEQHYSTNKELRDKISNLELSLHHERDEFSKKISALNEVMKTQQSYISEVEMLLRSKDNETQEIMINAQNQVRNLVQDSLDTLQAMGIEKQGIMEAQDILKNEFIKLKQKQEHSSASIKAHHQLSLRLCQQGLTQLSNISDTVLKDFGNLLSNNSPSKLSKEMDEENEPPKDKDDDNKNKETVDCVDVDKILSVEELMLSKLVGSILNSKSQSQTRQGHLETRMLELDEALKREKERHSEEIVRLQKKCKSYGQLIRKLRLRMQPLRNYEFDVIGGHPSASNLYSKSKPKKKSPMTIGNGVDNNPSPTISINQKGSKGHPCQVLFSLQEKHEHFQYILKNVGVPQN